MLKIEYISEKISNNIAQELKLDDDKKSVINYGIFTFIQMVICIVLVIIFGIIFHVVAEALIVSFTISILRKSSGGVHASSPGRCAIIGTVTGVGMGLMSKYINISFSLVIMIGCIIFTWSYYIVRKLAPVDSLAKPIKSLKKRTRLKKRSMMILSVYLIIIIVEIVYYYFIRNKNILVYSVCIYMGMTWQVFSLTKYGHSVMKKLDKLFK
ncbi:accessory gene regulator ArgB-like protein [Clostridium chromiireducens]|uniref:Accessory protein regulator protein B n=1 Tax=Clostridium chromiireducens TaxID=225345 RepID=A0A1V4IDN1_9CLOT|nr:accessory gene regulator B family protein [Clostridium chromiireducens]OPJ58071.1 accessory protein regulator protein B [Clostridium chromiireducens]